MNMEKVLPQELRIARARNIENWRQGKVLAVDDKVIWVRDGSEIYRVSTDMAAHPVLNGLGGARVQPEVHRPDDPDEREEGDHHLPCQTNSMTERSRAGLVGPGPTVNSQLTDSQPNQQENIDPQQLRRDVWEAKQAEAEERRGRKRRSEDSQERRRHLSRREDL